MIEQNFDNSNENNIEFLTGQRKAMFTFTARKYINKIKKYKESHPDEVDFVENKDGSICGHVPLKWIKVSPPRKVELTDEQRAARGERLKQALAKKNQNKNQIVE